MFNKNAFISVSCLLSFVQSLHKVKFPVKTTCNFFIFQPQPVVLKTIHATTSHKTAILTKQHMTCNFASSHLMFNSNTSSFVFAAFYSVKLSPTTTRQSLTLTHSLSPPFHQPPLYSILTSVICHLLVKAWLQLHRPLTRLWFWYPFNLPASQTSSDSETKHQHSPVLLSCSFGLLLSETVEAEQS